MEMGWESELDMLPLHMRRGVREYITMGVPPGGFLTALFENDLKGFALKADHINVKHLLVFVQYMVWHMPSICQGSPEKVEAWIAQGGLSSGSPGRGPEAASAHSRPMCP